MTKNDNPNRRPVIVAMAAASFLMLSFGIGYRVLAGRLSAPFDGASISPEALARFPMQIGDWAGQEAPIDEAVVRATDTDGHISRRYSRRNGAESASLYVAYGVKARDLMPHRPEVCYTGAGWTLVDRRSMELPLSDGEMLPCNVLRFSRGTLNKKMVVVLDYYIVDGQYCHDVSLLRSKAWRGSGKVGHVAQVQVVTAVTATFTADSAVRTVGAFAVESASSIFQLFEDAGEDQSPDEERSDSNGVFVGAENGEGNEKVRR